MKSFCKTQVQLAIQNYDAFGQSLLQKPSTTNSIQNDEEFKLTIAVSEPEYEYQFKTIFPPTQRSSATLPRSLGQVCLQHDNNGEGFQITIALHMWGFVDTGSDGDDY